MSRRRGIRAFFVREPPPTWIGIVYLRPVELARRERVSRQVQRVKRRAARRWTA